MFLVDSLTSDHVCEVLSARDQLLPLVEQFYKENEEFLAPQQFKAAKEDPAYFLALVELTIEYAKSNGQAG